MRLHVFFVFVVLSKYAWADPAAMAPTQPVVTIPADSVIQNVSLLGDASTAANVSTLSGTQSNRGQPGQANGIGAIGIDFGSDYFDANIFLQGGTTPNITGTSVKGLWSAMLLPGTGGPSFTADVRLTPFVNMGGWARGFAIRNRTALSLATWIPDPVESPENNAALAFWANRLSIAYNFDLNYLTQNALNPKNIRLGILLDLAWSTRRVNGGVDFIETQTGGVYDTNFSGNEVTITLWINQFRAFVIIPSLKPANNGKIPGVTDAVPIIGIGVRGNIVQLIGSSPSYL